MEMLVPITLFLCIAAVMILRPVSKNIGRLLEQMARERGGRSSADGDAAALRMSLDHLGKRLELMEERLDFTERLLTSSARTVGAGDDRTRLMR